MSRQQRGRGVTRGGSCGAVGGGGTSRGGGAFRGRGGRGRGRGGWGRFSGSHIFEPGTPAVPDQRLSSTALDNLVSLLGNLEMRPENPIRPGWGTVGVPIALRSNFFALRLPNNMLIYDYQVSIFPKKNLLGPRKARIFELLEGRPECAPFRYFIAHDRSQRLVSTRQLPQPLVVRVVFTQPGQQPPADGAPTYTVTVKFVRSLDFNDLTPHLDGRQRDFNTRLYISAMNLILQKHITHSGGVRAGQSKYFSLRRQSHHLDLGLEARQGYFMTVRPMYKQLVVNVNVCMAAFYAPGNLAQAMFAFMNHTGDGMPSEFAERMKIETTHLGYPRKRAIYRIMTTDARNTKFQCAELGGTISVEEYFARKYSIQLQYADKLPVINVGTCERENYLPAEICVILPGQLYRGDLTRDATRNMIDVACRPPAENANHIVNDGLPLLGLKTHTTTLDAFGVTVDPNMIVVPARLLPPPQILYSQGRPSVREASWNILDVKFQKGGDMTNWAVLLVQEGRRDEFSGPTDPRLGPFLETFRRKCITSGLTAPNKPTIMVTQRLPRQQDDPGRRRAMAIITDTLKNGLNPQRKPSFVLTLLSGEDKFIYPGIKRLCDMRLGLHTVCMLLTPRKAGAKDPNKLDQYFSSACLKVNVKLGGVNHLLGNNATQQWLEAKKTMLVGVDITRPSPTSVQGTPSIAAVVASVDDQFVQYSASLRLQESDQTVDDMTEMMVERLQLYESRTNGLPDRVIVYRNGLPEGEFPLVREKELPCLLKAFQNFNTKARSGTYRPQLTIIVCGKRHQSRFPATSIDHMARSGNTKPGTVVDKGVTAIYSHDFYLQAHSGQTGTVRPTHYTIIHDEIQLDADTAQGLVHNLSYLYARATKGVSLVPPAYYADLACERARLYLSQILDTGDTESMASRESAEDDWLRTYKRAAQQWGAGIHKDLKDSMFFI